MRSSPLRDQYERLVAVVMRGFSSRRNTARAPRAERPESTPANFRTDIEGLRAVAVGAVMLFHAGVPFLPGGFVGVDVFFVISGFLITGVILRDMRLRGGCSLSTFYVRRAKRLLPAQLVALFSIGVLTFLFLPKTRWSETGGDIASSALYFVNWRFAARAVDYLSFNSAPSIVQHFWSLSVEEQFYFVWPLLLLLVTTRARRKRTSPVRPILLALAVVFIPSIVWSVLLTRSDPARAYFVTPTRMWELALGGGLAVVIPHASRLPRAAAIILGWAGLGAIIATTTLLTTTAPFPGIVALVPTLGTAAVIASGAAAGGHGPIFMLGRAPMRFVGKISYSLYLWHWPLLVVMTARFGVLSAPVGIIVALIAVVPAYLSYRFVEKPIRLSKELITRPRVIGVALVGTAWVIVFGLLLSHLAFRPDPTVVTFVSPAAGGAGSAALQSTIPPVIAGALGQIGSGDVTAGIVEHFETITPDPLAASKDSFGGCSAELLATEVKTCVSGDSASKIKLALVGDSHMAQWVPALLAVANARGWRMTTYIKKACLFAAGLDIAQLGRPYPSCTKWNEKLRQKLADDKPDYVIVANVDQPVMQNGTILSASASADAEAAGMQRAWEPLITAGTQLVVLGDTPSPGFNIPECVIQHMKHLSLCAAARGAALRSGESTRRAVKDFAGITFIDMNSVICPGERCPAVVDGILVYRDTNHLTGTYVQAIEPQLNAALPPLVHH